MGPAPVPLRAEADSDAARRLEAGVVAGADADALGALRTILIGAEARRLDGVETELRALAASRLSRADLKTATAAVLADALREAEVKNHRALADALAPLVVRAIQAEIRNSRDAMVEALYPIVGRLVSAAVADGIRRITESIAERIDALISTRRWTWRVKAMVSGRSVAEVALAESQRARVTRVLCLERGSGQLIAAWPQVENDSRSDMMSGLIAAITEFAATTFAQEGGALRALDLGARRVLLRTSPTLIVAAECDGVLRPQDEETIDEAFLALFARHEQVREIEAGDLAGLDAALAGAAPQRKPGGAAKWVLRLAALALAGWMAWNAAFAVLHWSRARRVEEALATARAANPAAIGYPLRLDIDHAARRVALVGLAPTLAEQDRLLDALRAPAQPYEVIDAVEIVPPGATVAARVDKVEALARDADEVVAGDIADARSALARDLDQTKAALAAARDDAAATRALLAQVQQQLAQLKAATEAPQARLNEALRTTAVFFIRGSADFVDPRGAEAVAVRMAGLMKETGARLRVVGHTDETGSDAANQRMSRMRAEAMVHLLTKQGVPSDQLVIVSRRSSALATDDGGAAANRRVTFELAPANEPGR